MFGFFKKPKVSEEEKRAAVLPLSKKVQFEAKPVNDVQSELDSDIRAVLNYVPVNYYASKERYLLCVFRYNEELSEIFMQIEYCVKDQTKEKTRFWKINKELFRDIMRKFGQNI